MVSEKTVDDVLLGGSSDIFQNFLQQLSRYYTLGIVVSLPGSMNFLRVPLSKNAFRVLACQLETRSAPLHLTKLAACV